MKDSAPSRIRWKALAGCFVLAFNCLAENFVELTAEIQSEDWSYWFHSDELRSYPGHDGIPSIFTKSYSVRCVVGKDLWMMESDGFIRNARTTFWFTGTNLVEHLVITEALSDEELRRASKIAGVAFGKSKVGDRSTRIHKTEDGNPGRTVRVADLMKLRENIPWLAFCSGPCLQREGRKLFPPGSLWKETGPWEFSDTTKVFEDNLGLPQSVKLQTKEGQTLMRYQSRQSTNVLGWNFPLEFYLTQYQPAGTNGWQIQLISKGRLTSIKAGAKPDIPAGVMALNRN